MKDWLSDLEPETVAVWAEARRSVTMADQAAAIEHSKAITMRKQVIATEANTEAMAGLQSEIRNAMYTWLRDK